MKKLVIITLSFLILLSCNRNDDNVPVELLAKWLLIEQYADPGDGSGDFVSVSSSKTIEFYANRTVISNGSLCIMDINSDEESTGTYNDSENSITPEGCRFTGFGISYEIEVRYLIVNYPCIEACRQKFRKIG